MSGSVHDQAWGKLKNEAKDLGDSVTKFVTDKVTVIWERVESGGSNIAALYDDISDMVTESLDGGVSETLKNVVDFVNAVEGTELGSLMDEALNNTTLGKYNLAEAYGVVQALFGKTNHNLVRYGLLLIRIERQLELLKSKVDTVMVGVKSIIDNPYFSYLENLDDAAINAGVSEEFLGLLSQVLTNINRSLGYQEIRLGFLDLAAVKYDELLSTYKEELVHLGVSDLGSSMEVTLHTVTDILAKKLGRDIPLLKKAYANLAKDIEDANSITFAKVSNNYTRTKIIELKNELSAVYKQMDELRSITEFVKVFGHLLNLRGMLTVIQNTASNTQQNTLFKPTITYNANVFGMVSLLCDDMVKILASGSGFSKLSSKYTLASTYYTGMLTEIDSIKNTIDSFWSGNAALRKMLEESIDFLKKYGQKGAAKLLENADVDSFFNVNEYTATTSGALYFSMTMLKGLMLTFLEEEMKETDLIKTVDDFIQNLKSKMFSEAKKNKVMKLSKVEKMKNEIEQLGQDVEALAELSILVYNVCGLIGDL